jgi:hypothetical protein
MTSRSVTYSDINSPPAEPCSRRYPLGMELGPESLDRPLGQAKRVRPEARPRSGGQAADPAGAVHRLVLWAGGLSTADASCLRSGRGRFRWPAVLLPCRGRWSLAYDQTSVVRCTLHAKPRDLWSITPSCPCKSRDSARGGSPQNLDTSSPGRTVLDQPGRHH